MTEERVHRMALELPVEALAPDVVAESVAGLVRREHPLAGRAEQRSLVARVLGRLRGLGPIDELLGLDGVTEVMINGPGPVWVEQHGEIVATEFSVGAAALDHLIERMVAPLGRRLDRTSPLVDGCLPTGDRLHVALPPVAVGGPYVTIRRFEVAKVTLDSVMSPGVEALLGWAVASRFNLLISGATSTGKTTVLNSLAEFIPTGERLVTVEDAVELQLGGSQVLRLESRSAAVDGPPPVSIRELVRNALRMRPDRIIVGEVRGPEAIDMLQAMNTGHEGSLSTIHANSAADALIRLETMVLLGASNVPLELVHRQVHRAIDLVVHLERTAQGTRRVAQVVEPSESGSDQTRVLGTAGEGLIQLPSRPPRRSADPADPAWLEA